MRRAFLMVLCNFINFSSINKDVVLIVTWYHDPWLGFNLSFSQNSPNANFSSNCYNLLTFSFLSVVSLSSNLYPNPDVTTLFQKNPHQFCSLRLLFTSYYHHHYCSLPPTTLIRIFPCSCDRYQIVTASQSELNPRHHRLELIPWCCQWESLIREESMATWIVLHLWLLLIAYVFVLSG